MKIKVEQEAQAAAMKSAVAYGRPWARKAIRAQEAENGTAAKANDKYAYTKLWKNIVR